MIRLEPKPRSTRARLPGRRTLALASLGATLAFAACGEGFDPYSRLTDVRVLAVRSEPVAPAMNETTTLSALVYTPPGVTVTRRQWSWCPFPGSSSDGYPCQISEDDLAELGGSAASVPPFDLGTGETASFTNTVDPTIFAAICAGVPGQPQLVDCNGGFPVQVKLVVEAGGQEITAVRTLRLRFAADQEANANPTVDDLVALIDDDERSLPEADVSTAPTLPRRQETLVRAKIDEAVAESFTGVDEDGKPAPERERLIVSWFVESGNIASERTVFIDDVVDLADALENEWRPAAKNDFDRDTADIIVVVRDTRDGVTWRRGTVKLGDAD